MSKGILFSEYKSKMEFSIVINETPKRSKKLENGGEDIATWLVDLMKYQWTNFEPTNEMTVCNGYHIFLNDGREIFRSNGEVQNKLKEENQKNTF